MSLSNEENPYQEQFNRERTRLLTALGETTEGGIVDNLQHIGGTSIPQAATPIWPTPLVGAYSTVGTQATPAGSTTLATGSGLDIGLTVWPFPLQPPHRAALEGLGYEIVAGYEGAPEQRFCHPREGFQLYLVEPGSERWADYLILRDYLRQNEEGRQRYLAHKPAWAGIEPERSRKAKETLFGPMLEIARQCWIDAQGFGPVEAAAQELKEYGQPWYISSGWALDLFLGQASRVHHDIDVVVRRSDQLTLQHHLTGRGWKLVTPLKGQIQPWPVAMRLELPHHQVHAHREGSFIDFLLTDMDHGVWRYRRDPTIIQTAERLGLQTESGIPFLAPELVLLFKSTNTGQGERSKDESDFQRVAPHLPPDRRAWLRWALLTLTPSHPWLAQLV
jgi:GrpB-like predicted nucleotidyltransferase (UPF0157 family)